MLYNFQSLSIGTLDQNTAKGQNGAIALEEAMFYYQDVRKGRFVVINVEGYDCIAHTANDTGDLLDMIIFPYDEHKIYPMHFIELKYSFALH